MEIDKGIHALLNKDAIRDCLMRYAHNVDRRNRDGVLAVFWPDAVLDYGTFLGGRDAFVDYSFNGMANTDTHHLIAQMYIILRSDTRAVAETYFRVPHDKHEGDAMQIFTISGRYIDELEKRGNEWRILNRKMTGDIYRTEPSSPKWQGEIFPDDRLRGRADPDDCSSGRFEIV